MNNEPYQTDQPSIYQQQWTSQTQWGPQYPAYDQSQYAPYNVPPYAQPQQDQTSRFLLRWLMTRITIRVVFFMILPMVACGGCTIAIMIFSLRP